MPGLGVRITAGDVRAYILNYRTTSGRYRRLTLGRCDEWSLSAARDWGRKTKRQINTGADPMADRHEARQAPTMTNIRDRYMSEHAIKKRSGPEDGRMWRLHILPTMGRVKVVDVTFADVDALHRRITKRGNYVANRVISLLSKAFALSVLWGWRPDNPAKAVERNQEQRRTRYLNPDELRDLMAELGPLIDAGSASATAITLLLLTGARRNEVLSATWDEFDITAGIWVKPASNTKTKVEHRIPLSAPALALLVELRERAKPDKPHLFPGKDGPQQNLYKTWNAVRRDAGLPDVRLHDLRHSFASVLASRGTSLLMIGALLGHASVATTARYSHLLDDPLREATDAAGAIMTGRKKAEVVDLPRRVPR